MRNTKIFFITFVGLLYMGVVNSQSLDLRYSSVNCINNLKDNRIHCSFRYASSLDVKDIRVFSSGVQIKLDKKDVLAYPGASGKTAVLFLLDVSDPARKNTVEKKYLDLIKPILSKKQDYQNIAIATFDSEFSLVAPFGSDSDGLSKALTSVRATGLATEFYKNILTAIDKLKTVDASRKGLIILSDGKDEDKAYKREDVIKAANEAGISILGLGFSEKPADLPYLQTLEWLSKNTYGQYINATNLNLTESLLNQPFSFVEKGGEVVFASSGEGLSEKVELVLGLSDGKQIKVVGFVDLLSGLSFIDQLAVILTNLWMHLAGGLVIFSGITYILIRLIKAKIRKSKILFGYLEELDGTGTKHALKKSATRIGRSRDNDIVLVNDSISGHHAEIHVRREGGIFIVDLSSTNGVHVNDDKVNQAELSDGDLVELGEVRLRFIGLIS